MKETLQEWLARGGQITQCRSDPRSEIPRSNVKAKNTTGLFQYQCNPDGSPVTNGSHRVGTTRHGGH